MLKAHSAAFNHLAGWISTACGSLPKVSPRESKRALMNTICFLWYALVYSAIMPGGICGPPRCQVTPWWNRSCSEAAAKYHDERRKTNGEYSKTTYANLKATLQRARRQYNVARLGKESDGNRHQREQKLLQQSRCSTAKAAQLKAIDPDTERMLVGPAALECWHLHWRKHSLDGASDGGGQKTLTQTKLTTVGMVPATAVRTSLQDVAQDSESESSIIERVAPSSSEESGPLAASEAEEFSSSEEDIEPTTETGKAHATPASFADGPKRTLFDFFAPGSSSGFDETFCATTETVVDGYIAEAEADTSSCQSSRGLLSDTITDAELQAAQRRQREATRHGGDLVPNAALRAADQAWQLLLLAVLNAVMVLTEYAEQWRHIQIVPLMKGGAKRSRYHMDDFRPIGLIACIGELWEKIMLPRLLVLLSPRLGANQGGGVLGADACALFLMELLSLRRAGRCPDARNGSAETWIAFLDISSFFDKVWRAGLLFQLWNAGVRGRAFLIFRSYLEFTMLSVLVGGLQSEEWASTLGLLQGSVLAMLLAALYLSGLQRSIEVAECGARWLDEVGQIRCTHSRFFVDDGALPAETPSALQRMLDAAAAWARKWRITYRIGTDKSAIMSTAGLAAARRVKMYLSSLAGERLALPAVGRYKYLGVRIQGNLRGNAIVADLLAIGNGQTFSIAAHAKKLSLSVAAASRPWKTHCRSALRFQASFCPVTGKTMLTMSRAWHRWGRLILGWESSLSAPAVLGDLGWQQWQFEAAAPRIGLLARLCAPATEEATESLHAMLRAASIVATSWTATSLSIFSCAVGVPAPSIGAASWLALSIIAKRRLQQTEAILWITNVHVSPGLQHYVQGTWRHTSQKHIETLLYGSRAGRCPQAIRLFSRVRAGTPLLTPDRRGQCPACGADESSLSHLLRRCRGSKVARREWLEHLSSAGFIVASQGSDESFLMLVFDTGHPTHCKGSGVLRSISFVLRAASDSLWPPSAVQTNNGRNIHCSIGHTRCTSCPFIVRVCAMVLIILADGPFSHVQRHMGGLHLP